MMHQAHIFKIQFCQNIYGKAKVKAVIDLIEYSPYSEYKKNTLRLVSYYFFDIIF